MSENGRLNIGFAKVFTFAIMLSVYKTLGRESEFLLKEKGSKFIGYAFPCNSEEQFKKQHQALKLLHPTATHICYAYQFGVNKVQYRANDDGEPNNSAGAPILGQIHSSELTNVFIAVVRYYGGTKLGVSGLIQAYRGAAKEAILCNETISCELNNNLFFELSYDDFPQVMRIVKAEKLTVLEQKQELNVKLKLQIPQKSYREIKSRLENFSSFVFLEETIQQ